MAVHLQVKIEEKDQKTFVRMKGRLDVSSTPVLEKKLEELKNFKFSILYLDFSEIEYISSAALRLLLSLTKEMEVKKGALVLFSLTDEVKEVIKIAGFGKILTIFPNEKEALQFRGCL